MLKNKCLIPAYIMSSFQGEDKTNIFNVLSDISRKTNKECYIKYLQQL